MRKTSLFWLSLQFDDVTVKTIYCPVLWTALLEIIVDIDSLKIHSWFTYNTKFKVWNAQYCYKHRNKNYYVAFNSTLCYFLTYFLDWYLLNISGTYTPVTLCHTCRLHTHIFLAICSTLISLWSIPFRFSL